MEKEDLQFQINTNYTTGLSDNNNCKSAQNGSKMLSLINKNKAIEPKIETNCIINTKTRNFQVQPATCVVSLPKITSSLNSPKMGSRRIFTPQFKLQVLESYRTDNDCKGNQRATARKYNIHRRQIQKWLQCELNLRSSVANIDQSNVKHQFHHISHDHQHHIQQLKQLPNTNKSSNCNSNIGHHQHQQIQNHHQLSLDASRQSLALHSIAIPSLPVAVATTSAAAQEVLVAANFAAAIAAANATGQTSSNILPATPLRPTAIGGSSGAIMPTSISPIHRQPHQHHYSMPYTLTSASVSASLPIISHHIPPQQLHNHYQYHNLTAHSQTQAHKPSGFLPSACLSTTSLAAEVCKNNSSMLRMDSTFETSEVNHANMLYESTKLTNQKVTDKECHHSSPFLLGPSLNGFAVTPIDLSLGTRRDISDYYNSDLKNVTCNNTISKNVSRGIIHENSVVDLTFRKRKVVLEKDVDDQPEKQSKFMDINKNFEYDSIVKKEDKDGDDIKFANSKPIKLFKPYLLDENEEMSVENKTGVICKSVTSYAQQEPIIWSNHSNCLSPFSHDIVQDNSKDNNFQAIFDEKNIFPIGSPFIPVKPIISHSTVSPTSVSVLSPSCFRCPKGSPVSGYESSSSTYSDSSSKSEALSAADRRAFCIDVKMHTVYTDKLSPQQNHIQKWLDQDMNITPPSTNASIVIFA